LGGGDLEADGERVRCLRSRMASLSSLDRSLRRRSRECERSRLLCLSVCLSVCLCLSLSCERSRLRLPSALRSRVRSPCLSFSTERSRLLLSLDPSRRLSLSLSLSLSLEPSLRRSFDVSRLLSRDRLRSRDSSRRLRYGSGEPSRPRLLEVAVAVAVAAGEPSFGRRSLERSLCLLSRDLLLDLRREATEGSLLASLPARSGSLLGLSGSLLGLSASLLGPRSATTRGAVGTSPLASC
jgi:hypothetical protein